MKQGIFRGFLLLIVVVLLTSLVLPVSVSAQDDWFYERPQEKTDYAYSFAVVGDTQDHVWTDAQTLYDANMKNDTSYTKDLYKWIVDNKQKKNIRFVFGLGDITENQDYTVVGSDEKEWEVAKSAIKQLDRASIPYSLIPGNHDSIKQFDNYFGEKFYASRITGRYDQNSIANYYINFDVAGTKYMVLCLENGPKDPVVEWANQVIAAHPGRRVIITTHFYLEKDGSLADKNSSHAPNPEGVISAKYPRNNGDMLWDKLVSKHRNIIMVLSGHLTNRNIAFSQQKGVNGNTVSQFLVDPQDSNFKEGFICMLYFSADGKKASVEWISTTRTQALQKTNPNAQDVLYKQSNQFSFDVTNLTYTGNDPATPIEAITTYRVEKTTKATMTATTKGQGSTATVGGNTSVTSSTVTGDIVETEPADTVTTDAEPSDDTVAPPSEASFPIGIVIGGAAVLVVVIALIVVLCVVKKKKSEKADD